MGGSWSEQSAFKWNMESPISQKELLQCFYHQRLLNLEEIAHI